MTNRRSQHDEDELEEQTTVAEDTEKDPLDTDAGNEEIDERKLDEQGNEIPEFIQQLSPTDAAEFAKLSPNSKVKRARGF